MPLRPDCGDFDLHEPPRVRQASDLHRGPGGKPGLVRSAEELAVALHEAVEVHSAVLCRVADQEHGHVDHVAQRQSQPLKRAGDAGQRADRLCPGVAVGRQAAGGGGEVADGAPAPLRTTRVLPGGISTADRMGRSELSSGWRTTPSARAPPAVAEAASSRSAAVVVAGRDGMSISVQFF